MTNNNVTIVTGLWDLGRDKLDGGFDRKYQDYLNRLAALMKTPSNMLIYIDPKDEDFIWEHRERANTYVRHLTLPELRDKFEFFDLVQKIRVQPEWYLQAGWLTNSPQATLEFYNPVVMSKFFMLNDATHYNPFDSTHFYWIDAGITSTVNDGYFWHDGVFDNLEMYSRVMGGVTLLAYPYNGPEIHGFPTPKMNEWCNTEVKRVCRGGFFGGSKIDINRFNTMYHGHLRDTLQSGYMGTEESIFTIMAYRHPELVNVFDIGDDGMIWPIFERLKDVSDLKNMPTKKPLSEYKTNLYVLGFNSPKQFETVIDSIKLADPEMFHDTRKILINNSTDTSLFDVYDELCERHGFEEIRKENLGVCGGRQFAAEHHAASDADFSIFFEDDMLLNPPTTAGEFCGSGFRKYVPNLYHVVLNIMVKEKFDFLKFSFSELYMNNNMQVSWYNVPQSVRSTIWPEYDKLPEFGLDPNGPRTKFSTIEFFENIPYIKGEIFYGNWPQIVSREGNQKMFLDTTWARPYEQTWMSHIFQLTLENKISPAILLASPVTHNRFEFYADGLRRES